MQLTLVMLMLDNLVIFDAQGHQNLPKDIPPL